MDPFLVGKVAMLGHNNTFRETILRYAPDMEFGVSRLPHNGTPASWSNGFSVEISSQSKAKDAAWKFVDFITGYDVWMNWVERHGGPMPTRMDVCNAVPEFKDPKWQVILDAFPHAKVRPPIPEWPQVSDRIQNMVQTVITGKVSAEEAIATAEAQINEILGAK